MAIAPIIVNEKGDVSVYQTVGEGEKALEPIDVENGEYTVFDSLGLVVTPVVAEDGIRVRFVDSSPPEYRPDQLENILRRFLSQVDRELTEYDEDEIWGLRLDELVTTMERLFRPKKRRRWWRPW